MKKRKKSTRHKQTISGKFTRFSQEKAKQIAFLYRPVGFLITLVIEIAAILLCNYISLWFLFLAIPIAPIFITYAVLTLRQVICEIRVNKHEEDISMKHYNVMYEGTQGAGKTSSMASDYKIIADYVWGKIQESVALLKPFIDEIEKWPQQEKEDAKELLEAYDFYMTHDGYPCLASTVPIKIDGRYSYVLTADHLLQRRRMPYGIAITGDEIDLTIPQYIFRNDPVELKEFIKFLRHFGEFRLATTNQSSSGTVIYIRKSATLNRFIISQEWVLRPRFFEKVKAFLMRNLDKISKRKANRIKTLDKIISCVGYRKYTYIDYTNEKIGYHSGVQTYYLKASLDIEYDSRAFKNAYRCKNKPIDMDVWDGLRLSEERLKEVFSEELQEMTKSKAQRRAEAKARKEKQLQGVEV